jgi:hypothetical protein
MRLCAGQLAVISSTATPATATVTLHANLFTLPPLPLPAGCSGVATIRKFIIRTMMLLFSHDSGGDVLRRPPLHLRLYAHVPLQKEAYWALMKVEA